MATIGTFTKDKSGFAGTVKTLALNVRARITPTENDTDRGPDFRIFSGPVEFGAAWKRVAKDSGREYLSLKLEDPSFPAPIYCSLVASDDPETWNLIWNRPAAN